MSTVEETPFRPCPWCGSAGYQNDYLVSTGHVACEDCGIELPVEAWDTLSDAAALARAVDVLEAWNRTPASYGFGVRRNQDVIEIHTSVLTGKHLINAHEVVRPSFAAALIALAEQVTTDE